MRSVISERTVTPRPVFCDASSLFSHLRTFARGEASSSSSGTSSAFDTFSRTVSEGLPLPAYQSDQAAGLDLVAAIGSDETVVIKPRKRVLVPTGLTLELPKGFEGQVRPRSGLALKHGLTVPNTPGTSAWLQFFTAPATDLDAPAGPVNGLVGKHLAQNRAITIDCEEIYSFLGIPGSAASP